MTTEDRSALIPPLDLQPAQAPADAEFYQLDDLVRYHDRTFISYAYAALARRAPTPEELAEELDDLRSGRREKLDIIEGLLNDSGGKSPVRVVGLRGQGLRRASRWPVVGYAWRLLRGLASLPRQLKHQQRFEAYAIGQQQKIADHINGVIAPALADSIDAVLMLSESLQGHAMKLEDALTSVAAQQQRLEAKINAEQDHLQAKIDEQQQEFETKFSDRQDKLRSKIEAQQHQIEAKIDAQRHELEERLNGQQELIVQEERVIVETQKVVMEELRSETRALAADCEQRSAELLDHLQRLQASVGAAERPARKK